MSGGGAETCLSLGAFKELNPFHFQLYKRRTIE